MSFVHLHVHSSASDGLASPEQLAREAKRLGYHALALTDHNTLSGHNEFADACLSAGVEYIYGAELRVRSSYGVGHTLVLVSTDHRSEGYTQLRRMVSWPTTPAIHHLADEPGLIVASACLGGEVAAALRRGDYWTACDVAAEYREALGNRYYLEVQPSFGAVLPMVVALGHDLGIPVIGTNDVHYLSNSDALEAEPGATARMNLDLASEEQLRRRVALSSWQYAMDGAARLAEQLTRVPTHA